MEFVQKRKVFLFMYPREEIFDFEIERGSRGFQDPLDKIKDEIFLPRIAKAKSEEEKEAVRKEARQDKKNTYTPHYVNTLNQCIQVRYRENGFAISYALFDDDVISPVINLGKDDTLIRVGMNSTTHYTKGDDGNYPYPDNDFILDQLGKPDHLRIGGFHSGDCVEKIARRAHERGLDVLVDEDLTEFLSWRMKQEDFRVHEYHFSSPKFNRTREIQQFLDARRNKPWLIQGYTS